MVLVSESLVVPVLLLVAVELIDWIIASACNCKRMQAHSVETIEAALAILAVKRLRRKRY